MAAAGHAYGMARAAPGKNWKQRLLSDSEDESWMVVQLDLTRDVN